MGHINSFNNWLKHANCLVYFLVREGKANQYSLPGKGFDGGDAYTISEDFHSEGEKSYDFVNLDQEDFEEASRLVSWGREAIMGALDSPDFRKVVKKESEIMKLTAYLESICDSYESATAWRDRDESDSPMARAREKVAEKASEMLWDDGINGGCKSAIYARVKCKIFMRHIEQTLPELADQIRGGLTKVTSEYLVHAASEKELSLFHNGVQESLNEYMRQTLPIINQGGDYRIDVDKFMREMVREARREVMVITRRRLKPPRGDHAAVKRLDGHMDGLIDLHLRGKNTDGDSGDLKRFVNYREEFTNRSYGFLLAHSKRVKAEREGSSEPDAA